MKGYICILVKYPIAKKSHEIHYINLTAEKPIPPLIFSVSLERLLFSCCISDSLGSLKLPGPAPDHQCKQLHAKLESQSERNRNYVSHFWTRILPSVSCLVFSLWGPNNQNKCPLSLSIIVITYLETIKGVHVTSIDLPDQYPLFSAKVFAPCLSNALALSRCPKATAKCNGVLPRGSLKSMSC